MGMAARRGPSFGLCAAAEFLAAGFDGLVAASYGAASLGRSEQAAASVFEPLLGKPAGRGGMEDLGGICNRAAGL